MPLTIGPYSLTIIKENGTEMNYGTKNLTGNNTIYIKFRRYEFEVSDQLKCCSDRYGTRYMSNIASPFKLILEINPYGIRFLVDDRFEFQTSQSYAHATIDRFTDHSKVEHYYGGLEVTTYCNYKRVIYYDMFMEMHNLVTLILGISQLDVQLANELLELQ